MKTHYFRYWFIVIIVSGLIIAIPFSKIQAITLSPVRLELSGDPGTTVGGTFKIINEEKETKTLYTVFANFEAMGETGSPSFKPGNESLASWITAPKEVTVAAGETKIIDFSVNIPTNAEPGGYFAAIFLATSPPSAQDNQLTIGTRVGILLLFRVNGDIKEEGALLEFKTKDNKTWYNALPVNYYYRFQNSGNDRVMPRGQLTIKNLFGMTTKTIDSNAVQGNVLPRSIRRFELWWQKNETTEKLPTLQPANQNFFETVKYEWDNFAFGRYKANLDLNYGTKGEKASASFIIFIFPWQLLLVELVFLILVVIIFILFIKRYNKWIIRRARRS